MILVLANPICSLVSQEMNSIWKVNLQLEWNLQQRALKQMAKSSKHRFGIQQGKSGTEQLLARKFWGVKNETKCMVQVEVREFIYLNKHQKKICIMILFFFFFLFLL